MVRIDTDAVKDEKEAEFLMVYHLRMAARYFEATGLNMVERLPADEWAFEPMKSWVSAMEALYPDDEQPNAETQAAMREENRASFNSVAALMQDLNKEDEDDR